MCFFNSSEEAYLEQNEPASTLKIVICRKLKVTQMSQDNYMLDSSASKADAALSIHICFPSTQLNRPFWKK
jgi:hypothetical protein